MMKQCPFCGMSIRKEARFCLYCGKSLIAKKKVNISLKRYDRRLITGICSVLLCLMLLPFSPILFKTPQKNKPDFPLENETASLPSATTEPLQAETNQSPEEEDDPPSTSPKDMNSPVVVPSQNSAPPPSKENPTEETPTQGDPAGNLTLGNTNDSNTTTPQGAGSHQESVTLFPYDQVDKSEAVIASGTSGSCSWELRDTHLIVYGSGEMANYTDSDRAPWNIAFDEYNAWGYSVAKVTVCDGVTSIGDYAFTLNTLSLTEANISDSVQTIGKHAFDNSYILSTVRLGKNLTAIQEFAFRGCKRIRELEFPDTLKSIGESAFCGCLELAELNLPTSLQTLGKAAFKDCQSLKTLTIPSCITVIPASAFNSCVNLETLILERGVTVIGERAFYLCKKLVNFYFPKSLETVEKNAFGDDIIFLYVHYEGSNQYDIRFSEGNDKVRNAVWLHNEYKG